MSKNFNIIITAFVIWISLYTDPTAELFVSGIFVLSLGLMHVANDINLLQEMLRANHQKKWWLIGLYVSLGLIIFTAVYYLRILGLIVFMLFSSYHFGEQHLHRRLKDAPLKSLHFTLYGLVIFTLLFSTHVEEVQYLILHMTGFDISVINLDQWAIAMTGLLIVFWLFSLKFFKKEIFEELFYILMFYVVFYNTELYLAFALYFVVWHALPSIQDQILIEGRKIGLKSAIQYVKQSAAYWLVSVIGIFILAKGFDYLGTALLPVLFAALVAITFPHILLISRLISRLNKKS